MRSGWGTRKKSQNFATNAKLCATNGKGGPVLCEREGLTSVAAQKAATGRELQGI